MLWNRIFDPVNLRREVRRITLAQITAHLGRGMRVYDIGCGAKPFKTPVEALGAVYVGVDIPDGFYDPTLIDLPGSAYAVPAPDGAADAVISCQVLEHLDRPRDALREARRLLKDQGLLFVSTPFLYPLHAAPRDFFRYTPYGLDALLAREGLEVLEARFIGGFWYALAVFTGIYLQGFDRGILRKTHTIRILSALLKWIFLGMHTLEGALLRLGNKDAQAVRAHWAVNHLMVVRKVALPAQGGGAGGLRDLSESSSRSGTDTPI